MRHHRLWPRRHRFDYGLFLLQLDLDELPELHQSLRLFSHNRRNWYEFRDTDHLQFPGAPSAGLKASVLAWLQHQGVLLPADTRISLVTLPRVAGYVFNPVSFLFLEDVHGKPVGSIAEVGNTFGELKPYWIPVSEPPDVTGSPAVYRSVVPKEFYVSPFSDLQVRFDFRIRRPGDRLDIVINDVTSEGQTLLHSSLMGDRRPLDDHQLLRLTLKYPLVTLRVIYLIHWQALQLWLKRIPWHRKQDNPQLQRALFRPHASITQDPPAEATAPSTPASLQPSLPGSLP